MFSYAIGQFMWMLSCAAQLVAAMGTGLMWMIQVIRLFCSISVVWFYFIPHFWWYFTSSNVIYHVSYRSSETTRRRNLLHVLEAEGVDLVELLHREQMKQEQMRIHRSRVLRKRAMMMKARSNKNGQCEDENYINHTNNINNNNNNKKNNNYYYEEYKTSKKHFSTHPSQSSHVQELEWEEERKQNEFLQQRTVQLEHTQYHNDDDDNDSNNDKISTSMINCNKNKLNDSNKLINEKKEQEEYEQEKRLLAKPVPRTLSPEAEMPMEQREPQMRRRRVFSAFSEQPRRSYEHNYYLHNQHHRFISNHQKRLNNNNNNSINNNDSNRIALERLLGPLALHLNPADGRHLKSLPLSHELSMFPHSPASPAITHHLLLQSPLSSSSKLLCNSKQRCMHSMRYSNNPLQCIPNPLHEPYEKDEEIIRRPRSVCEPHAVHRAHVDNSESTMEKRINKKSSTNVNNQPKNDSLIKYKSNDMQQLYSNVNKDDDVVAVTTAVIEVDSDTVVNTNTSQDTEKPECSSVEVNDLNMHTQNSHNDKCKTTSEKEQSGEAIRQDKRRVMWKETTHEPSVHTQASPYHVRHHNVSQTPTPSMWHDTYQTNTVPRLCQEDEEDRLNLHNRATLDIILPVPLDTLMTTMDYAQHHEEIKRKKFPVIILISGASWIIGSQFWTTMLARVLAARGYVVFCPDYRNFPQTTMEGMTLDVSDAIAWVLNNAERYNGDLDDVTLLGQSAGAHLTMMSILSQAHLSAFEANTSHNTSVQTNITTNNMNNSNSNNNNSNNGKQVTGMSSASTQQQQEQQHYSEHTYLELPLTDFDGKNTIPPSSVAYNVPRYNPRQSIHNYVGLSGFYDLEHLIRHFDKRGLYRNVLYQIAGNKQELTRYSLPAFFDECRNGETGEALPDNIFDFLPANMFFLHGDGDKTAPFTESMKLATTLKQAQRNFALRRERRLAMLNAHIEERRQFFMESESSQSLSSSECEERSNSHHTGNNLNSNNSNNNNNNCCQNREATEQLESGVNQHAIYSGKNHSTNSCNPSKVQVSATDTVVTRVNGTENVNSTINANTSSDNSLLSTSETAAPVNIYYALSPGLNHTEAMLEECIVAGESTVSRFIANFRNNANKISASTKLNSRNASYNTKKNGGNSNVAFAKKNNSI